MSGDPPRARYVFRVRFRLDPPASGLHADPAAFETTVYREADPPGEEGWLFFRDNLWRGELASPDHFRELTEEGLGVPVESVSFGELRTTAGYRERLRAAVAEDLDAFNADTVDEALGKYLGSSVHVVEPDRL